MTPAQMAALHAAAMETRAWSAEEFRQLISTGAVAAGDPRAFALARIAADEMEILTVATDPAHRRQGLARACLDTLHRKAAARNARRAFLEVAAANTPARSLYDALGYTEIARRKAYYVFRGRAPQDAVVMALDIIPATDR